MNIRRIEAQQGAGRRRVWWEREGGLIPPLGISQTADLALPTFFSAIMTGLGLGVGFAIMHKLSKRFS